MLLQAAAALPMRLASAVPLCDLAAGRTRLHTEVQPTTAGALPRTSTAEAPEPPRPKPAQGSKVPKALSAGVHRSVCAPDQSERIVSRRRAQTMVHLTCAAAAPSKAASFPRESSRPKPVSGLRELLALGACHSTSDHMPDQFQQFSGRLRAQSTAQQGAARHAPNQPATKPSQPPSPRPAKGDLRSLRVQLPRLRATPLPAGPESCS